MVAGLAPWGTRSPLGLGVPAELRGQDWQAVQEYQPERRWLWRFEAALADKTSSAVKQAADGPARYIESGSF